MHSALEVNRASFCSLPVIPVYFRLVFSEQTGMQQLIETHTIISFPDCMNNDMTKPLADFLYYAKHYIHNFFILRQDNSFFKQTTIMEN